jgi:hypothetical protein
MAFNRFLLLLLTTFVLLAGIGCLIAPAVFAEQAEFSTTASALTEIRAFYGGLQIGIGLFLVWCLRASDRISLGLALGGVAVGCTGLARLFGIIIDQAPTAHHLANLGIEAVTVLLVAVALLRTGWRSREPAV